MSEYQYYEFQAIDRPLTQKEMEELRRLSTRAEITPHSFTNEYHWGDFKGDANEVLARYFDAHLYFANWGSHHLGFRLPRGLVEEEAMRPYFEQEANSLEVSDDHVVLWFTSDLEDGWDEEDFPHLASLLPLRADLLAGDFRCLYLAWLSGAESDFDSEEDEEEPPVPPGLKKLTGPLRAFADFMRVDEDLLAAAAQASPDQVAAGLPGADLSAWLAGLPASRKDSWLVRLAEGEGNAARIELLREFRQEQTKRRPTTPHAAPRRTLGELRAYQEEKERERRQEEQRRREAAQRKKAQERARYLDGLKGRQQALWRDVESAIKTTRPAEYDRAVTILTDLRDLADREGTRAAFDQRLGELRQEHHNKPSLRARLNKAGLGG
jgi:hypothetical protein